MSLPKQECPLFDITIPSLKKKVKFRPYLVLEEKILLMATENRDETDDLDIINAVKQVINNCCQDSSIDVDKLATFDLDYVYLKLYAKSVNNKVQVTYKDLEDEKTYSFDINLDTLEIIENPNHNNKIKVSDEVTLKLRYPTVEVSNKIGSAQNTSDILDTMLVNCVDSIYDKETVYTEYSEQELREFLEALTIPTLEQIKDFFATLPQLKHTIQYTNEKGTERRIELTSLRDFFTFL